MVWGIVLITFFTRECCASWSISCTRRRQAGWVNQCTWCRGKRKRRSWQSCHHQEPKEQQVKTDSHVRFTAPELNLHPASSGVKGIQRHLDSHLWREDLAGTCTTNLINTKTNMGAWNLFCISNVDICRVSRLCKNSDFASGISARWRNFAQAKVSRNKHLHFLKDTWHLLCSIVSPYLPKC